MYKRLEKAGEMLMAIAKMNSDNNISSSASSLYNSFHTITLENAFFTEDNIRNALICFGENLSEERLLKYFSDKRIYKESNLNAAVIIPEKNIIGGFSDMIRVLLYGYNFIGRVSKTNRILLELVADVIIDFVPEWKDKVKFTEEGVGDFDVLFTNELDQKEISSKKIYSRYDGIVREKKKSIAVLTGKETKQDLLSVVDGMMAYFGQNTHSISKILIPEDYNIVPLLESFEKYEYLKNHNKYLNNYEYYRSVYLLNREKFFDNEIIVVLPDNERFISPLGVMYFSFYQNEKDLLQQLSDTSDRYKFVYSKIAITNRIPFNNILYPDLFMCDDNQAFVKTLDDKLLGVC